MTKIAPAIMLATPVCLPGIVQWRRFLLSAVLLALAGCSNVPRAPGSLISPSGKQANPGAGSNALSHLPVLPPAGSGRGGYYQDDGPGDKPPDGLLELPDIVPTVEPYSLTGNKPYVVFGKTYTPLLDLRPFKQRGVGSWYGKKFHGQKTSSGERYDMYKLTAAHPTLPIPSYARVTNLSNGVQIIVRINDRGPFHSSRIIDLSYTAALKLGYLGKGSSELEVERLLPEDIARITNAKLSQPAQTALAPVAAVPASAISESLPLTMEELLTSLSADSVPVAVVQPILPPIMPSVSSLSTVAVIPDGTAPATIFDSNGAASGGNWDVQLGAFTDVGNAEAVRVRLMQTWDSALPPLEVTPAGGFYRLHSGPFPTRAEAVLAAQKVQAMSEIKPMVVRR